MTILRATAVINWNSNEAKEAARNVWHFGTADPAVQADYSAVGDALATFYEGIQNQLTASIKLGANAHRIECASVTPNGAGAANDIVSPIQFIRSFQLSPMDNPLPTEVAVALSFRGAVDGFQEQAADGSRPRSRKRGRVFLGPLGNSVNAALAPTFNPQVSVAAREAILDAYDNMTQVLAVARPGIQHMVYSRVNGSTAPVVQVSVDNEFDTIRSRGRRASLKMTRAVVTGQPVAPRDGADVALAR